MNNQLPANTRAFQYTGNKETKKKELVFFDETEDEELQQAAFHGFPKKYVQNNPPPPKKVISRKGCMFDWNGEFQKILSLPDQTREQKLEKYSRLR